MKELLWREIRARKSQALEELPGTPFKMQMEIDPLNYMLGFSTKDVQQAQGFHSANIMIIIDEANGYPEFLFDAIDGLLSGGVRHILFMISNAIEASGRYFRSFSDGETWTHSISCLDHPNVVSGKNLIPGAVVREWVEKMRRLWGEDSAFWQSRVLGDFPKIAADIVVNLIWVETAESMPHKVGKGDVRYMGVDAAEYGTDSWVWYIGTEKAKIHREERHNIEPSEGIGITKRLKEQYNVPGKNISIDAIGAGATAYSVLREDGIGLNAFRASETAHKSKEYEDIQTEAYFNIRNILNPNSDTYQGYSLGGRDDQLKADLCTRKFKTSRHGRIMLEPKEAFRTKFKRSPNHGDAFVICYSPLVQRDNYGIIILPDVMADIC